MKVLNYIGHILCDALSGKVLLLGVVMSGGVLLGGCGESSGTEHGVDSASAGLGCTRCSRQSEAAASSGTDMSVTERFLEKLRGSAASLKRDGDRTDTLIFGLSERKFADAFLEYVIELQGIGSYDKARREIGGLLAACDTSASVGYRRFLYATVQCAEKVLYNPRSPYVDEELYLPFAEHVVNSKYYPEEIKLSYKEELRLASKNRIGTPAADFEFAAAAERRENEVELKATETKHVAVEGAAIYKRRLYDIDSEYTLIYFNDPECSSCKEMTRALLSNKEFLKLLSDACLKVLSLYIGHNMEAWKTHRDEIYMRLVWALDGRGNGRDESKWAADVKQLWIEGYDCEGVFESQSLYVIRAIPSFYLLDSQKRVVLKDASLERVLLYFRTISPDASAK